MKNLRIKKSKLKVSESGFGLIEIVIASAVIGAVFIGVAGFLLFSQSATSKARRSTEAVSLAEEALEAVRKLRDESWTNNIANKTVGTTYYPNISGSSWVLQTTNPTPTSYYTTTLVFSAVNRDGSFNIATSGTNDPDTRRLVATVSWNDSGPRSVAITTYITNFNDN